MMKENANEKTKYKLATAIRELMYTYPLDKITVRQITETAGVSRQTFYRNFQDKYDLVNWYFEKLCQKSFKQMGNEKNLFEALKEKFEFLEKEQVFFSQAFQSQDCNSLVAYDFGMIMDFYTHIIVRQTNEPLDDDIRFLLEMYCRGSIDMTVRWVTSSRRTAPEKIARLLIEAMPGPLEEYLCHLWDEPGEKQ